MDKVNISLNLTSGMVMKISTLIFFFKTKARKRTREHDITLMKGKSSLDVRKYSLSQRTVNEWNKLSTDCVHASSVNYVEDRIDKCLVRAGYT